MKTKVRLEIVTKKNKTYTQIYLKDTDILLATYIVGKGDTLSLSDLYMKVNKAGTVQDFT